ncbi:MAG: PE domain-containing protein [Mycobacterium sp.]
MLLDVNAEAVAGSSVNESAISAEIGAATAATSAALTCVLPMGADLDSVAFAAALNAAGASYIATATEHLSGRTAFAEAQGVAAVTYTALDVVNNTALAL